MNLQQVVANIERFKHVEVLRETISEDGFIYTPLKKIEGRKYGFIVFSEEEYQPALESLSCCQYKHRYYYYEKFDNKNVKEATFIMFNPSSACPDKDDPTIKNCRWLIQKDYAGMEIINIFSERNPKVKEIKTDDNTVNFELIKLLMKDRKNIDVIVAWGYGKEKDYKEQIAQVEELLTNYDKYKITIDEEAFNSIKDFARHPAPSCWSAFGGFKNAVKLTKFV